MNKVSKLLHLKSLCADVPHDERPFQAWQTIKAEAEDLSAEDRAQVYEHLIGHLLHSRR